MDYQSFLLNDSHNIQQTLKLFYYLIASFLSYIIEHYILYPGIFNLFCLNINMPTLYIYFQCSKMLILVYLNRCLNVKEKCFLLLQQQYN